MRQYIVDAFTREVFHGNQAAVCILDKWPSEQAMMKIAMENNFSETAFAVKEGDKYHLRWFTPGGEIDLCGHATLATGYVLLNHYLPDKDKVVFTTMSGDLIVSRKGDLLEMEFPAYELKEIPVTDAMTEAFGAKPVAAYMGRDLLCVFDHEDIIRNMKPDQEKVKALPGLLQHVTAKGSNGIDCVSRSFAPKLAVAEDPVCGSGHCHIIPYWAKALGKDNLVAYQASKRGGTLYCHMAGKKVFLAGPAAQFSVADLNVEGILAAVEKEKVAK